MSYTTENSDKTSGISRTFAPLPNWLLSRKEISLTAKVIYARLLQYKGKKDHAYPGRQQLADECGLGVRTLERAIEELKKFDLIIVKRRGHTRSNMYTFPLHIWMSDNKKYKPSTTFQGDSSDLSTNAASDLSNLTTHDSSDLSTHDSSLVTTQYEKITEKIVVEEKRDFSTSSYDFKKEFEEFWNEYPLKRHKKLTSTHFISAMEVTPFTHLMEKVRAYKRMAHQKGSEKFFISSHKWLKEERWNDCYGEFEKDRKAIKTLLSTPASPVVPDHYKSSWEAISGKLKERKGAAIHKAWFEKICLGAVEGDMATIHASTNFIKTWNETHFKDDILDAIQAVYPNVSHLKFIVC